MKTTTVVAFYSISPISLVFPQFGLYSSASTLLHQSRFLLVQLNPYNYEKIEVVLKIIEAVDDSVTAFSITQVKKSTVYK